MATTTLENGDTFALPINDPVTVKFDGTSLAGEPVVNVVSIFPPQPSPFHELDKLVAKGSPGHLVYGEVSFTPSNFGLTIEYGVHVSYGDVSLVRADGGPITLKGNSTVAKDSAVTVYGGRYQADPLIFNNAKLTVSGNSTLDSTTSPIQGTGTIKIDHGSTVDVKSITAGVHVNDSGLLNFTYGPIIPTTTAPIDLASNGVVDVELTSTATSAVLHQSTDILDLMGPTAGAPPLISLQFTGDPKLYVTPDGHGGMDITTHEVVGSLTTIFSHT
jgi:hypothetical protein